MSKITKSMVKVKKIIEVEQPEYTIDMTYQEIQMWYAFIERFRPNASCIKALCGQATNIDYDECEKIVVLKKNMTEAGIHIPCYGSVNQFFEKMGFN